VDTCLITKHGWLVDKSSRHFTKSMDVVVLQAATRLWHCHIRPELFERHSWLPWQADLLEKLNLPVRYSVVVVTTGGCPVRSTITTMRDSVRVVVLVRK
jgi:hypothetical protein